MWWNTNRHEPRGNSSLQIHILQQFWKDVSQEILVKSPGQTRWKKVGSKKSVLLHCLHGHSRWTLDIFFNHQETVIPKPRFKRPIVIYIGLYTHTYTHALARARAHTHTHTHTEVWIFIFPSYCMRLQFSVVRYVPIIIVNGWTSRERKLETPALLSIMQS